jgi:EAL domain-containing protein (putative c-di-GMP-specific phosphodiesterase class I)/CheY-like chemotaxis protein
MTDRANPIAVRILVLDDEPVMLELLSRMLSNLGLTDVTACDTGQRALELLDGSLKSTDLILLDLNMPGMDGIEFLRELDERRYTGSVLLTSGADEQVLQSAEILIRAHSIRALGHLQKPVQPDALAAMLASWRPATRATSCRANKTYAAEEVRRAIANRELVNDYQPIVTLAAGNVVGVETLVRWRHPVDGLVFPDQFIGVAEANGLIDDLTHVVIGEALAQTRLWLDTGLALHTSVNVSMDNLRSLNFPDIVSKHATAAGVPAADLVLEITESRLMKNLVTTLDVLTRLRLKHFRLSIDDFGTGHSSLAQLRDIPFDELKIDRSFVHGAATDDKKRAICNASLGLARQLGISAVAEGVEDQDDWRFLRGAGCDFAQGYFIAKPMSGDELPAWIDGWVARVRGGI